MREECRWDRQRVRADEHHSLVEVRPYSTPSAVLWLRPSSRQHNNLNPVTQEPLEPKELITLHYSRKATGELHDPISFKPFSEHSHIVAVATTGNVFLADSVKGGRDLVADISFKKYVLQT